AAVAAGRGTAPSRGPARPGPRSEVLEGHFAGLDGVAVDEQPALAVEPVADSFDAVDPQAPAAQEVARADAVEDRVQTAGGPGVVVALEPRKQVGEQRRAVALAAVDRP